MRHLFGICCLILGLSAFGAAQGGEAAHAVVFSAPGASGRTLPNPSSTPTLWIIPHTHWEGAVFKTRDEYLEIGLPHILTALNLLRTNPDYRFVLDQVAYVKPFLQRYPEEATEFQKYVSEGRLQIVGANDVMLDVNIPSGESWVRQVLYGKRYYKRELGVDVTVGWALDTFGHHGQMPQLLKLAGYKSYWFQRGVPGNDTPSEFSWEGIDGTQISAFWLPLGYGLLYPSPTNLFDFSAAVRGLWESLGRYSQQPDRVALAGADVIDPEESLPRMVSEFDRESNQPLKLRFGVPTDFESIAAERADRPVITGELNPVFQGTYSNRIEIKHWMRSLERILTTAEKLSALRAWLNLPADTQDLTRAWEPVLFNEAHDLTSGTMVDKVYADTVRGYGFAKSLGDEMVEADLDAIASRIDTRAAGEASSQAIPVVVFNSLGWLRTDVAQVKIGFSQSGVNSIRMIDSSGRDVAIQLLESEEYPDGGIRDATVAFVARDVPAMGYSIYHTLPVKSPAASGPLHSEPASNAGPESASTERQDTGSIENEYYRATFDLWTGALTRLDVKSSSGAWNAIGDKPANVVAEEQDGGDFWELYGTLNGGRFTAMTRKQGLPIPAQSHLSDEWVGGSGATEAGPVFAQFHISHPFGSGRFATRVRLYRGIQRIDIETQILNNDKFVRYRMLVPTSIASGKRFDEIPFGSVERPIAQEFPAQNWIDWGDGARGVALLNCGLPGNNVSNGTLILSLMRSATITAYPFSGGYEPGASSDLGLELGEERTFDYALVPHLGNWQEARIYRAGLEFNNPLIARKTSRHGGPLPSQWGLLEINPANVVTSALKVGEDGGLILRVYEAAGKATPGVKIKLPHSALAASEVNLIEQPIHDANLQNDSLSFNLRPYEIKTFRIELGRVP
ncbi:MAG TPA: glycoside hydrolase family 38 C-terminal domain-containing protein [Terriglobia bacterium]